MATWTPTGGPALLGVAVLLLSLGGAWAVPWKSTLSLNPPWNRIFREENVTLTCTGSNGTGGGSTKWLHNDTALNWTAWRLDIVNAAARDSGEYRCQHGHSVPSRPVRLDVLSDWLLIQSSADVVLEGQSFLLRCLGWRHRNVFKVIYYRDGVALRYWYENYNLTVANATEADGGSYRCGGTTWRTNHTSDPLRITVRKGSSRLPRSQHHWLQLLVPTVVGTLFAADTGLWVATRQQLAFLLTLKRTRTGPRGAGPRPEPGPRDEPL